MRAGLLTYHFSDNYGALLQAYALRKWLLDHSIEAEFVNYEPAYVEKGGPLDRPWKLSLWRKNATIFYMKQAYLRRRFLGNGVPRSEFDRFRAEHLGLSGPQLTTAEALRPHMSSYQILICGSDQIWNPSIQRGLDPVYFLDIPGAEHAHKVAYAPSFGRGAVEPKYYEEIGRLVSGLDGISVRETTGLDILETAGVKRNHVRVVPDPTILLGRFDDLLEGGGSHDDSVFCYALRTDEVIREVAVEVAKLIGGPLRAPRTLHQRWKDIGEGIVPGPVEWLQTLARAKVVVSNSFHGVALSVALNRPFIAVGLPGKRAKMNVRVQNLLAIAGLADRMVGTTDPARICALVETPIDWETANARLSVVRAEAEAYLEAQIAAARGSRKEAAR